MFCVKIINVKNKIAFNLIQTFFVKMFKIVKILFFIDEKLKIVREKKRNLNITNKKQIFENLIL